MPGGMPGGAGAASLAQLSERHGRVDGVFMITRRLDAVDAAAPRRASDSLVDLRTGMPGGMPDMSGMGGMGGAPAEEPADEGPKIEEID